MYKAIDLYSGIGGWTLGMKLAGVENMASFEWWFEANQTHNFNFKTNHKEIDIRSIVPDRDLTHLKGIDFVVGSPPCTQFSFANRGGNGDLEDGMKDVAKFLEIVEYLKPKYWAMENVPRVAGILERELNEGSLTHYKQLVSTIAIVDTSEYGVPQSRKRMVAGHFPFELFESYKQKCQLRTLGQVLQGLAGDVIEDINYGYGLSRSKVTELENEVDLTKEEERINKDSKTYHPIYNKMAFPDKLDRPSRTITATCTRVSRESIIVKSDTGFRRLNVRERGVLQGFPITYQFYGRTLNSKFKMIGNAVPPILTYYLFQSMLEVKLEGLKSPFQSDYFHEQPAFKPYKSNLGLPKRKYPAKRKFQFAVPNLRYGSGVRFELSNDIKSEDLDWSFKFFYGNSKNIKSINLDKQLKESLAPIVNTSHNEIFTDCVKHLEKKYKGLDSAQLQDFWVSTESDYEVFCFLDEVGKCVRTILEKADFEGLDETLIEAIVEEKNKKLNENHESILTGFYFLSSLNNKLFNR